MHAGAGVPIEQLHIAGVVHNKATHDVLDNVGYREKYGVDNPNLPLLVALEEAGVAVYICGQSISARGVDRTEIHKSVGVGLSAMTIILSLQSDGYQLIKFWWSKFSIHNPVERTLVCRVHKPLGLVR